MTGIVSCGASMRRYGMPLLIAVNEDRCTGCKTCELVCSVFHSGESNPERAAIRVVRKERDGLVFALPLVCQQCEQAPCIEACPTGGLHRECQDGTLVVDDELCTACGVCTEACPAGCIFIDPKRNIAICCDLCGGQPQCVEFCHAHCLTLVTYDPTSKVHGVERLASILAAEPFAAGPMAGDRR